MRSSIQQKRRGKSSRKHTERSKGDVVPLLLIGLGVAGVVALVWYLAKGNAVAAAGTETLTAVASSRDPEQPYNIDQLV